VMPCPAKTEQGGDKLVVEAFDILCDSAFDSDVQSFIIRDLQVNHLELTPRLGRLQVGNHTALTAARGWSSPMT